MEDGGGPGPRYHPRTAEWEISPLDVAIIEALHGAEAGGLSPADLVQRTGWSRSSIYARLPVLTAAGKVVKRGRARWSAT